MVDQSILPPTSTATSAPWRAPRPFPRFPYPLFLILATALVLGCASTDQDLRFGLEDESVWDRSQADAAAYGADSMTFRKPMKVRSKNDFEFYYKRCELTGNGWFVSKTSYWCSEP